MRKACPKTQGRWEGHEMQSWDMRRPPWPLILISSCATFSFIPCCWWNSWGGPVGPIQVKFHHEQNLLSRLGAVFGCTESKSGLSEEMREGS